MSTRRNTVVESLESRRLLSSLAADLLDTIIAAPTLTLSASATGSATGGSTVAGLNPAQVRKAYGIDQISFAAGSTGSTGSIKGDGSGQTIAIVGAYDAPTILSDLKKFDAQFGLADPPSIRKVSQSGSATSLPAADAGWALELSLDVEWAHAAAPKANILLVEARSASLGNLLSAVDYARNAAGVSVVSMSWGADEFWGETNYDGHFTTPAGHQGVTFVAASGDDGSWYGPEWPAVSSGVLSVGGTTLSLSSTSGSYGSERGWGGSGGGVSWYEAEPTYQYTVNGTGWRASPDVAYDADPRSGFAVYDSTPYGGGSGWQVVGGTSAGAPQWAGLIAIANQARSLAGKSSLNGLTQTLPALYAMSASNFHDITIGRSSYFASAFAGYDIVTGLGTPRAVGLVAALKNVGGTSASSSVKTSVATVSTAAKAAAVARANASLAKALPDAQPTLALPVDHATVLSVVQIEPIKATGGLNSGVGGSGSSGGGRHSDRAGSETIVYHPLPPNHIDAAVISLPPAQQPAPRDHSADVMLYTAHPHPSESSDRHVSPARSFEPEPLAAGMNLASDDSSRASRTVLAGLAVAAAVVISQWHARRRKPAVAAARRLVDPIDLN